MIKLLACLPTIAVTGLLIAPASAQAPLSPPSPAGAASIQDQIQATLDKLVAKPGKLPNPAAQVTPAGDHYALSLLLAPLIRGFQPPGAAFTAALRPLNGGWSIDDEQYPSEFEITASERPAGQSGTPQADDAPLQATWQVKLGPQDEHATFDPNGLTASTSSGTIASIDIVKTGGSGASLSHFGRISNQGSVRPSATGHYDLLSDVAVDGYAGQFASQDQVRSEVTAARLHVSATMTGVSADAMRQVSGDLLRQPRLGKPGSGTPTPAERAQMRETLIAAEGLLVGAELDEEADGVKFEFAGHSGGLNRVELSFGGQAPQDSLSASLGITLEGLKLDELPPALAAYLPTRIAFHPTAANLSVTALTKLALDSLAPDRPSDPANGDPEPPVADFEALFSHGGIQVGFDQLAIDMAGTQFSGTGLFTLTGPQTVNGAAQITAHGLDDLIERLQADPVAAKAAPVIILLKGIAKTTPDGAVWQITVQDRKVLVNGLDLGAMAAAMGK